MKYLSIIFGKRRANERESVILGRMQAAWCCGIGIVGMLIFLLWATSVPAQETTVQIDYLGTPASPTMTVVSSTYPAARDGVGNQVQNNNATIGQYNGGGGGFSVYRAAMIFAGIPGNIASISSATLTLNGSSDLSATDFNVQIFEGTFTTVVPVATDFPSFDGRQTATAHNGTSLSNVWSTADYSADANVITFNAAGLAKIYAARGDTLRLMVISSRDSSNTEPTGNEYVVFEGTAGTTPFLTLTYTPSGEGVRGTPYDKRPNYLWNYEPIPIWKP